MFWNIISSAKRLDRPGLTLRSEFISCSYPAKIMMSLFMNRSCVIKLTISSMASFAKRASLRQYERGLCRELFRRLPWFWDLCLTYYPMRSESTRSPLLRMRTPCHSRLGQASSQCLSFWYLSIYAFQSNPDLSHLPGGPLKMKLLGICVRMSSP